VEESPVSAVSRSSSELRFSRGSPRTGRRDGEDVTADEYCDGGCTGREQASEGRLLAWRGRDDGHTANRPRNSPRTGKFARIGDLPPHLCTMSHVTPDLNMGKFTPANNPSRILSLHTGCPAMKSVFLYCTYFEKI